jgi:hypothetical protein
MGNQILSDVLGYAINHSVKQGEPFGLPIKAISRQIDTYTVLDLSSLLQKNIECYTGNPVDILAYLSHQTDFFLEPNCDRKVLLEVNSAMVLGFKFGSVVNQVWDKDVRGFVSRGPSIQPISIDEDTFKDWNRDTKRFLRLKDRNYFEAVLEGHLHFDCSRAEEITNYLF